MTFIWPHSYSAPILGVFPLHQTADVAWLYVCYFQRNCFWKSNAPNQEALAENGFWNEIATKVILGHSFCNQPQADKGEHIAT